MCFHSSHDSHKTHVYSPQLKENAAVSSVFYKVGSLIRTKKKTVYASFFQSAFGAQTELWFCTVYFCTSEPQQTVQTAESQSSQREGDHAQACDVWLMFVNLLVMPEEGV